MDYQITKIVIKDDYVKITVEDDSTKIDFKISIYDYLDNSYTLKQNLLENQIEQLHQYHTYYYAYSKALRKLGYSDYSEKEMLDFLSSIDGLSYKQQQMIFSKLKQSGYIADEVVSANQLYNDQNRLLGVKKTRNTLKKRGISSQISEELLANINEEEELERGLKKANLILQKIKGKSYKETIELIKEKLIIDGFENVGQIFEMLDYQKDDNDEITSLLKQANKAIDRYRKKYTGKQLKFYVYKYLLSKGYQSSMIEIVLNKLEEEDEN